MQVNPLHSLPESIRESIVLAVVPTTGSIRDQSSLDNTITVDGNCYWNSWRDKWGAFTDRTTGALRCGDFSGVDFSSGITAFVSFHLDRLIGSDFQALIGGTSRLYFDIRNNKLSAFTSGLVDQFLSGITTLHEDTYYTSAFTYDGIIKRLYLNANEEANENTSGLTTLANIDLLYEFPSDRFLYGGLHSAILCQGCVSPTNIIILDEWANDLVSPRFRWQGVDWPTPIKPEPNLVGAWDCGFIDQLVCEERSGNADDGIVSGNVHPYISPIGRASRFDGETGIIDCGDSSILRPENALTVVVTIKSNDIANSELVNYRKVSANLFTLYMIRDDSVAVNVDDGSANGLDVSSIFDNNISDGLTHHVVLTFNRSDQIIKSFVDGIQQVSIGVTGGDYPLNSSHPTLDKLYIGGAALPLLRPADCIIKDVEVYDISWSNGKVQSDYNEFAKIPTKIIPIEYAPESLSPEGGGQHIRISDLDLYCGDSVGRWQVIRDDNVEGNRAVENQISGLNYAHSQQAYGTWKFSLYHENAGHTRIVFISSVIASTGPGYMLEINSAEAIGIIEPGVIVHFRTVNNYIDFNIWYDFWITRSNEDEFTIYIKGGNFTNWTIVQADTGTNPFIDSTIKTSKYIANDLDTGDRHGPIITYAGVVTP